MRRVLLGVALVLAVTTLWRAAEGLTGWSPDGSGWSCGSVLNPRAISRPDPSAQPVELLRDLSAAQAACAEARDIRQAEVVRMAIFFLLALGIGSGELRPRRRVTEPATMAVSATGPGTPG